MSDPPPPYMAEAIEDAHSLKFPSRLVVHLQVWHYKSEGKSPRMNQELASRFQNHHIRAWEVVVPDLDGVTDRDCLDQYVPVEVQFRHRHMAYNDPGEYLIADVKALFYSIAPRFIYDYFIEIRSVPHNLNIYPVDVPEEFSWRYEHAYVLNRLHARVDAFFVPGPMRSDGVQSWWVCRFTSPQSPSFPLTVHASKRLGDAVDTTRDCLKILSMIVSICASYRQGGFQAVFQDSQLGSIQTPEQLQQLFSQLFPPQSNTHPENNTSETQVAFDIIAMPMHRYRRAMNLMRSRLEKLESDQTLSNQDLYDLVQSFHHAGLYLSALATAADPLVKHLRTEYNKEEGIYKSNRFKSVAGGGLGGGLGVGGLAVLAGSNPLGLIVLGGAAVGSVAGSVVGYGAHRVIDAERGKSFEKKVNINQFKSALKDMDDSFSQVSKVIAEVFSSQVMRVRLDKMPEHQRQRLLESLGVDIGSMDNPVYIQELVRDRLIQFRRKDEYLSSMWDKVEKDADFGMETVRKAV